MEFKIKTFLKAKTAEELERKMLENSIKLKAYVPYQVVFANNFWFAWYEIGADQLLVDRINDITKRKG
jgi:hypothetical protein